MSDDAPFAWRWFWLAFSVSMLAPVMVLGGMVIDGFGGTLELAGTFLIEASLIVFGTVTCALPLLALVLRIDGRRAAAVAVIVGTVAGFAAGPGACSALVFAALSAMSG